MMEVPKTSRQKGHTATGNGCPPENVWSEICSGAFDDVMTNRFLEHASHCFSCGQRLADAANCLAPAESAEEQAALARLASSSEAWQSNLANRLRTLATSSHPPVAASLASAPSQRSFWFNWFSWPALGFALAAVCVAVVALFFTIGRRPSDGSLLAAAYDKQRPSDLRLPGTEPGPVFSPIRGAAQSSDSSELLRVKVHAQESFEKHPNDPAVRQTLGRIALVEHDGEAARRHFEMAAALRPDLPGLKFDLASANFEVSESSDHPLEYTHAIEFFSEYLDQVHGKDPVALFDLGLCWERQSIIPQAIQNFEAALALEKDPRWQAEIRTHLQKLKADAPLGISNRAPVSWTPADFLSAEAELPGQFEIGLALASRSWLPERGQSEQVDAALQKIANMGLQHGDHWLTDMLRFPDSPAERAAEASLAEALTHSLHGEADGALAASAHAMSLFHALGNHAGYVRAAAEHLYTLQRMGLNQQCLREAAALATNPHLSRDRWLRLYVALETSAARWTLAGRADNTNLAAQVAGEASAARLPLTVLRATSFLVDYDMLSQHYASSWSRASSALNLAAQTPGAEMPRFQLFNNLMTFSQVFHLRWTQCGLAAAAAEAAARTPNRKTEAYALEDLALAQLQVGQATQAAQSFHSADALLSALGRGVATARYAADWKTDRALLEAAQHGPGAAAHVLATEEPAFREPDAVRPRIRFYTEYADLLRRSGQVEESLYAVLKAIGEAEARLSSVRTEADRRAWSDETHKAYEILVLDLAADPHRAELALRAWEWLRSAPFRSAPVPSAIDHSAPLDAAHLPAILPQLPPPASGSITLIFARVLDGYVAWSLSSDPATPVRMQKLSVTPAAVDRTGAAMLRLCADPTSSMNDLSILGAGVFAQLLGPFGSQIQQTQQIRLDLDPSLAEIPFAALVEQDSFVGLRHSLLFLPAGWQMRPSSQGVDDRLPERAQLSILQQTPKAQQIRIPGQYDEANDIAGQFPGARILRASLRRSGTQLLVLGSPDLQLALQHADVVHYSGHGLEEEPSAAASTSAIPADAFALAPGTLLHCRIAVLAACRTLREREETAEDVPSFADILLHAGASHVLATQWDVDSRMTRLLMLQFYRGLSEHQNFAEALRRAQQTLQAEPSARHPYFWSGFQLVGP
jgi:CHAT domain-containing protein